MHRTHYDRRVVASTSSVPPATEQEQGPSTRARLLDAAYELLLRDGYNATTVQGVARRAGLTTGAIYANFVNKQELMALAVLERWQHLQRQLVASGDPEDDVASGDWALEVIAQLIAAPPAAEHRLLTEVTAAAVRDSVDGPSPLRAGVEAMEALIRGWVEQSKAEGKIDERLATDALVAVILNMYLGANASKTWGLEQPNLADVVGVLNAAVRGFALGPEPERS